MLFKAVSSRNSARERKTVDIPLDRSIAPNARERASNSANLQPSRKKKKNQRAPGMLVRDVLLGGIKLRQTFPGAFNMSSRPSRRRNVFQFESLEIRNAPSHFGAVAHLAAAAVHHVHHVAAVHRFHDSQAADKSQKAETYTGVETSPDPTREITPSDPSNTKDPASTDP
jgi:hypothetical protein